MLFGFVVFLSALLLFLVQLIVAKHLLPWFGGTPAVWTTSQMFFQVMLLGGYAYAHGLGALSPRRQYRVHLGLLVLATAALVALAGWGGVPLLAPADTAVLEATRPVTTLLTTLLLSVGLPFFAVSTTGPLVQAWHTRRSASIDTTYRLYALSNVGSFLALFSYPLVVEQYLDLPQQAWVWAVLFVVFGLGCGLLAARAAAATTVLPNSETAVTPPDTARVEGTGAGVGRVVLWLALSATSSVAFLATTNQLTQDIASVPFLWVLPLATYLLTFIICFDRPRWYSRRWWTIAAAVTGLAVIPAVTETLSLVMQVAAHCGFLLTFCMLCHGELVRHRPSARHLTLFYLLVALGGALGGIFVSVVAPAVFPDLWEFQLVIPVGWLIVGLAWWMDRTSPAHVGDRGLATAMLMLAAWLLIRFPVELLGVWRGGWIVTFGWPLTIVTGALVSAVVAYRVWHTRLWHAPHWPRAFILFVLTIFGLAAASRVTRSQDSVLYAARNFYGVVKVTGTEEGAAEARRLVHGTTLHGVQVDILGQRTPPTAYYSPSTGIAVASTVLVREQAAAAGRGVHLGVLGMGAGTMSGFVGAGDHARFYEINPEVIAIAQGPYFTYLRHCACEISIASGDGRLVLERELREAGPQQFDLLAVDAFASDSVPVHLVTREAFALYTAHLRDERSILAVNVTNRYINLEPVIASHARHLGLHAVRVDSDGDRPVPLASSWILMARSREALEHPALTRVGARLLGEPEVSFTDSYSNLFRVLY